MSIRFSRFALTLLIAAVAVVMTAQNSFAIRNGLGPSKDEWGLKYDVAMHDAGAGKVDVVFTVADDGRLKPLYSVEVVAFSKQTDSQGGRSYDAQLPFELKETKDGTRTGKVQLNKDLAARAHIRIITLHVDGKRQPSGGVYYNIPLKKYLNQGPQSESQAEVAPLAPPSLAKPRPSRVTK